MMKIRNLRATRGKRLWAASIAALTMGATVGIAVTSQLSANAAVPAARLAHVSLGVGTIATLSLPGTGGGPAGGVVGEGSPAGHGANSIDILSWSWGASNSGSITTRKAGASHDHWNYFSVKKTIDKSSPVFMRACASGQHLGTAYIYLDRPAGSTGAAGGYTTVATFKLTDVVVQSVSYGISSGDEMPNESITFAYGSISYDVAGATGTAGHFGWNLLTNKPI